MIRPHDSRPLSEFQADPAAFLARLKQTGRAQVLTVDGEPGAVLMSPEVFDRLAEQVEILRSVESMNQAVRELERGEGVPMREALEEMIARATEFADREERG